MARHPIFTDPVVSPVGPFRAVTGRTSTVHLSGQVAPETRTSRLIGASPATQRRKALTTIRSVLPVAEKSEADVPCVGLYVTDLNEFAAVNAGYHGLRTAPYPGQDGDRGCERGRGPSARRRRRSRCQRLLGSRPRQTGES